MSREVAIRSVICEGRELMPTPIIVGGLNGPANKERKYWSRGGIALIIICGIFTYSPTDMTIKAQHLTSLTNPASWKVKFGGMTFLEDVDIAPDGNVWVAGSSIAHNRDGGIWKSSELPPMNLTFDAIAMTGDSEGWALGRRAASIAEIPGVIGRVTEGRWHEEVAINDIEWNKLEKVAKNDIWAIGDILDRSRLYHYDGVSWKDATAQIEDFTTRATYITAVSYTHLDVYKRQSGNEARFESPARCG